MGEGEEKKGGAGGQKYAEGEYSSGKSHNGESLTLVRGKVAGLFTHIFRLGELMQFWVESGLS